MSLPFKPVVSTLQKHHERSAFTCGKESIDRYLHQQSSQDMKRRLAAVFVLQGKQRADIAAFYALFALSIDAGDLTSFAAKNLPKMRPIPCTLLGQFAVDLKWKKQSIGGWMLVHVMQQVLSHSEKIASFALVVDAVDDEAQAYWKHCGFISFPNTARRLFIPIKTIKKWLISLN